MATTMVSAIAVLSSRVMVTICSALAVVELGEDQSSAAQGGELGLGLLAARLARLGGLRRGRPAVRPG